MHAHHHLVELSRAIDAWPCVTFEGTVIYSSEGNGDVEIKMYCLPTNTFIYDIKIVKRIKKY
jgi:hypothetical protein